MAKKQQNPTVVDWKIKVNLRAWEDPEFKKRLLKNPRKALEEIGYRLNEKKIIVVEESADTEIIVLCNSPFKAKPLSEKELGAAAAAGASTFETAPPCITYCGGCGSTPLDLTNCSGRPPM